MMMMMMMMMMMIFFVVLSLLFSGRFGIYVRLRSSPLFFWTCSPAL